MQFSDDPPAKGGNGKRAGAKAPAGKKRKASSASAPKQKRASLDEEDTADSELTSTDNDSESTDAESPASAKPKKVRLWRLCTVATSAAVLVLCSLSLAVCAVRHPYVVICRALLGSVPRAGRVILPFDRH